MNNESVAPKQQVNTEIIKCDACGANMLFHPQTQTLYCEHCGSHREIANARPAEEIDIRSAFGECDGGNPMENATVFSCDNCGAKVAMAQGETAKCCPFCGTAHVTSIEELQGLKPTAVVPFLFDKEKAIEFGKKWAKKRIFAPRKFKKTLKSEEINGVYTPSFTFDSVTTSSYVGRIGVQHTRTVGTGKNRRVQTYIVWHNISGTYKLNFNDVLIAAGAKFDQKKLDKVRPFDTNGSASYDEGYLLGYMSYRYDEGIQECWDKARSIMDGIIRKSILSQYKYTQLGYLNVSTSHENVTYKYVLLPVYVGNFNYGKKLYNYYVNGSTGKVMGKCPVSPWRVGLAVLLGIGVAVGLYFLISFLLT